MKKAFYLLAIAALFFSSCGKDKEIDNLAQQMLGKWMLTQLDGHIMPTNEKVVYTFESATQGFLSASRVDYTADQPMWANHIPSDIVLTGNIISMTGELNKTTSFVAELTVKSISSTEMVTESKYTVYRNGTPMYANSGTVLWTKIPTDYSVDILGIWEGRVTGSEGSEFDDGELHRWEYLDNGKYIYYRLDENGQWVSDVNELAQYIVDGVLLCTRWLNSGEGEVEHREWWEIASIENDVMNWTALRLREDGTTYTATFSMTKVRE